MAGPHPRAENRGRPEEEELRGRVLGQRAWAEPGRTATAALSGTASNSEIEGSLNIQDWSV